MRRRKFWCAVMVGALLALLALSIQQAEAGMLFRSWLERTGMGMAQEMVYEGELVGVDQNAGTITLEMDGKAMTFKSTLSADELAMLRVGEPARVTTQIVK